MQKMPMCPMMMGQMPTMPMMQQPMQMSMPMQMNNPMCMQMPMMEDMDEMEEPMIMSAMDKNEDDMDEEYYTDMYGDTCHKMMPYIKKAVDRMENDHDIYEERPDRDMVDRMTEEAYRDMLDHMPELNGDMHEERQYYGPGRFARDLAGVLLINELLGRRRRRRRQYPYPGYGAGFMYGPGLGYGPEYGPDFGYNDYYYYD